MRREEFLKELEILLKDLPEVERTEALEYYREYFEDAGREREGEVIQELGSPRVVAEKIREGLKIEKKEWNQKNNTIARIVVLVLLGVLVTPVLGTILSGGLGIILAVMGIFFGIVVSSFLVFVVGVALIITGIAALATEFLVGLALFGIGLILASLGSMATVGSTWCSIKVFVGGMRGISNLIRKLPFFKKGVM